MRSIGWMAGMALAGASGAALAQPVAHFSEVSYRAAAEAAVPKGQFRNPIIPGFQPDPSIVRVGDDFYLVNSTFAFFPGIPVYHSRDLVNWRLVSNAIDRGGMLDFTGLGTSRAVFAPTISHSGGKFRILNTCIECGGNFMVTADRAEGPWSKPIWLDFDGIDPALFVDDDGSAWIVHNGPPEGTPRYRGHTALWLQRVDLVAGKMVGPSKVLVDGGVVPADNPIWIEGPHIFKHDGWYYLMPAEGGTEVNHAQTIFRSRQVDGPYVAGPVNPILTQRDLPVPRPDRVEDTGHADLVQLKDGSWWAVFLATRPFAGKSTLMGRETFLLPVSWQDGWPLILPKGQPVPLTLPRPNLPSDPPVDYTSWTDRFTAPALSPEWLRLRSPQAVQWAALDRSGGGLDLIARKDAPGSKGEIAFMGRRLRHNTATYTATLRFAPERSGDSAGLLALADDDHFLTLGLSRNAAGAPVIALRARHNKDEPASGVTLAEVPGPQRAGPIQLSIAFDGGTAQLAWRPAGKGAWRSVARDVNVEFMAQIHAGLFTGLVVGPYAVAGQ